MRRDLENWAPQLSCDLLQVPADVRAEMHDKARDLERHAKRRARRRSGALIRSLEGTVRVRGGVVEAALQSDHPAARIQDVGGRVRARGRRMPVPIGNVRISPRSVSGLFLLRAKNGKRLLATRTRGSLRLWFRLMDEVRVPGNRYATKALRKVGRQVPDAVRARIHERVTR